ncbi:MAG: efflux RND transporter periplasmic adaptor subunit, partial [Methylotenera sp.]|nr:efflux RND transporter periplasmic adaptor subunit [Methylotenera sp.]
MLTQKKYRFVFIFIAIVVLIFAFAMFGASKPKKVDETSSSNPKPALTVDTVKVSRTTLDAIVSANGNIAPWQEALIGSEVNGLLLTEVLVNVGDNVKRGQVLARFSSSTINADIAQAAASLAEAKASAIEASGNANRARSIKDSGALSAQLVEQYISTEASTKAHVEAAEATLNLQRVKLRQTTVVAPDNGIISARTATVGSVASAGQELFRLVRQGRLEWRAEMTSADVGKIKIGMIADLTLPDGNVVKGKVRAVAPSIDSQTRNAIVYVDLPGSSAKAGMYARGKFVLANTQALTLPATAVVIKDGFSYAMQVTQAENAVSAGKNSAPIYHVKQLKLETGRRSGD